MNLCAIFDRFRVDFIIFFELSMLRCAAAASVIVGGSVASLNPCFVRAFFTPEPGPNMAPDKPHGLYTVSFTCCFLCSYNY